MEKLNFWEKISRSFNASFSKEAIKWSLKEGFKYFSLLILLITIGLSLWYTVSLYLTTRGFPQRAERFFSEELKNFPELKVENGEVFSTKDPFLKEWIFEGEKVALVIDTAASKEDVISGKYISYRGGIFILKKEIISKSIEAGEREKIESFPLPEDSKFNIILNPQKGNLVRIEGEGGTFELTTSKITRWLKIISILLFPFLSIILFIFNFIANILRLVFFSIISLITNGIAKTNLKYSQLLNIGIFALTLPLILETFVELTSIEVPFFSFFTSLLYAGLLIAGVLSCRGVQTPLKPKEAAQSQSSVSSKSPTPPVP